MSDELTAVIEKSWDKDICSEWQKTLTPNELGYFQRAYATAYRTAHESCRAKMQAMEETIKKLETRIGEYQALTGCYIDDNSYSGPDVYKENAELRAKLDVAKEALEFINTFKHPDYISFKRGTVFDVSRNALKVLSEG